VRRALVALVAGLTVALQVLAGPASAAGPRALPPLPDQGAKGEWWFTSWRIPEVWQAGARGQGVTVGLIDSGVQASFPELAGAVLPGTDFAGGDGRVDVSQRLDGDDHAHGTQMALLIAGQGGPLRQVGVAPDVKILPVVKTTRVSMGDKIRWAVDHGAKVVNLSIGEDGVPCSDDEAAAVRYTLGHGAVVVAASGNEGSHSVRGYAPADCPGVLAVGAVDMDLNVWGRSNQGPYLGASAPGVHIPGPNLARSMGMSNGTSAACALTSAAVALVWSRYPKLTNRQVVARLLATARDEGPPGRDDAFGYGVIRPYQAITTDVPADAPNPVFDAAMAAEAAASPSAAVSSSAATASAATASAVPHVGLPGLGVPVLLLLVAVAVVAGGVVLLVVVILTLRRPRPSAIPPTRPGERERLMR